MDRICIVLLLIIEILICFVGLLYGQSRSIFYIEIPLVYGDHMDVAYIKVTGTDRLSAITSAGMTVFTKAEWDAICNSIDCSKYKISDRTKR